MRKKCQYRKIKTTMSYIFYSLLTHAHQAQRRNNNPAHLLCHLDVCGHQEESLIEVPGTCKMLRGSVGTLVEVG
jgi:hypothetical protein